MELTAAAYQRVLETIETATTVDALAALRRQLSIVAACDESVRHLEQLIDAKAQRLTAATHNGLGPAPPALLAVWIEAVASMDRETLAAFTLRTWRAWEPGSLEPVGLAIADRRRALDAAGGAGG